MMIGAAVRAQLDALEVNDQGDRFLGYGEQHAWTHKSCLWNLPYFDDLLLSHNIDVMHTKKNVTELILIQSWTFLIRQRIMLRLEWIK